jgi:hypothetical protein
MGPGRVALSDTGRVSRGLHRHRVADGYRPRTMSQQPKTRAASQGLEIPSIIRSFPPARATLRSCHCLPIELDTATAAADPRQELVVARSEMQTNVPQPDTSARRSSGDYAERLLLIANRLTGAHIERQDTSHPPPFAS